MNLFTNRSLALTAGSWICLAVVLATGAGAGAQPAATSNQLYQKGRLAFDEKNYRAAIKYFEGAYPIEPAMNHKALICQNLAVAYEQLAADSSQPTEERLHLIHEALRYFGLYNELRSGEMTCLIGSYSENLELQAQLAGQRVTADKILRLTLDEFRSAYRRNPNPDLLHCIAGGLKDSAQDTRRPPAARRRDAEQSLSDYREYERAAQGQVAIRPPREVRQAQAGLEQLIAELRAAEEHVKPVHKKTWFRAMMTTLAVGVAAGITAGITVRALNPPDLLKVPESAWSKDR